MVKNEIVLFCGYGRDRTYLIEYLERIGFKVFSITNPLSLPNVSPFIIISYGYNYIIPEDLLKHATLALNLHISYLPYNKGANPHIWAAYEKTLQGVTIHRLEKGLDTGSIYVQKAYDFSNGVTLDKIYWTLQEKIQLLFTEYFNLIYNGSILPHKQEGKGSYHRKEDIKRLSSNPFKLYGLTPEELRNIKLKELKEGGR